MNKKSPILLLGSGRSGTTWLLDALARSNNLRTIFEPLHPTEIQGAFLFANSFYKNGMTDLNLYNHFKKYLYERNTSLWCDCRYTHEDLTPQIKNLVSLKYSYFLLKLYKRAISRFIQSYKQNNNRRIVKLIRANLMLGWLREQFPEARIVFVLRHPCAVVASKMKRKDKYWNYDDQMQQEILHRYLSDDQLKIEYRKRLGIAFPVPTCEVSAHAFMWCVENVLPLAEAREDEGVMVTFYEHLVTHPRRELLRLKDHLFLERVPEIEEMSRPSLESSREVREQGMTPDHLLRWRKGFDKAQLHQVRSMLRIFHMDTYDVDRPLPVNWMNGPHEAGQA